MYEISLAQGRSVLTMLAVAVIAIAMASVFYARAFRTLKPSQWRTLLLLRSLAIILIVLLLFRPVVSFFQHLDERPGLIFLIDRSSSMGISDGPTGVTRFNQARAQIESWWDRVRSDFDVHLIEFAEQAQPLEGIEELAALRPDGTATSLSRALEAATRQMPGRHVEAAILLSDGVHNAARDPLEVAMKLGMVVHTVGVGASLRSDVSYRDVQVVGLDCPDRLLLNNIARITASIEAIGLAGRVVPVILEEDGEKLLEQELALEDRKSVV